MPEMICSTWKSYCSSMDWSFSRVREGLLGAVLKISWLMSTPVSRMATSIPSPVKPVVL